MRRFIAMAALLLALTASTATADARATNRYPAPFERAFLRSCNAASGGLTSICRCELRWLEQHYTYRQVVTIYLHDQARMRRIILRAALACTR